MTRSVVLLLLVLAVSPCAAADGGLGAGEHRLRLKFGGRERNVLVHVPASYDPRRPIPVVLSLHGGGGNAENQRRLLGLDGLADAEGFAAVYPEGTSRGFPLLTWNTRLDRLYAASENIDDVGFLRAVVREMSRLFAIDKRRVYAAGISQGAIMSYRLACEAADVFAAVAAVAGATPPGCRPSRPVSVIHFHGKQDGFLPYEGGVGTAHKNERAKVDYDSVAETIALWRRLDGLPETPAQTGRKGKAEFMRWGPGPAGAEVVLWTLDDGGHTWPGGPRMTKAMGPVNRDIDASSLMWEFFRLHPMR